MKKSELIEISNVIEYVNLSVKASLPTAHKPENGDLWLSKDDRMIVVTRVDETSNGDISRVHAYINGEWLEPSIRLWPMVLLSLQAKPLGKLKV